MSFLRSASGLSASSKSDLRVFRPAFSMASWYKPKVLLLAPTLAKESVDPSYTVRSSSRSCWSPNRPVIPTPTMMTPTAEKPRISLVNVFRFLNQATNSHLNMTLLLLALYAPVRPPVGQPKPDMLWSEHRLVAQCYPPDCTNANSVGTSTTPLMRSSTRRMEETKGLFSLDPVVGAARNSSV